MKVTYFYRQNPDRSIVAICPLCYLTAATATDEKDLHALALLHECPTSHFVASAQTQGTLHIEKDMSRSFQVVPLSEVPNAVRELRRISELNQNCVLLLLTDADLALTFIQCAEISSDSSRADQAVRHALRAYQVICEKRPKFCFSNAQAQSLEIKLDLLRAGLTRFASH